MNQWEETLKREIEMIGGLMPEKRS